MREARSDSPTKCGLCGGKAYTPDRFANETDMDGMFNVCRECGAEVTGTGAYTETDRWLWTDVRTVERGRAAMEAMEIDAAFAEEERYGW